ncbi:trypsin-like cysteine/serine peptidase domain-containing protein [Chaetomium sp. MPI-CAGE-AT-0009]|nr:trypsin-like cysteine/serine peptidase domain-containing protein [Chaetomium sp. MPI-CAGE-AT-0009]
MGLPPRQTRLQKKKFLLAEAQTPIDLNTGDESQQETGSRTPPSSTQITLLPTRLLRSHTKLSKKDHDLLLLKQARLQASNILKPSSPRVAISSAISATLIFAQAEAGTAVCIHDSGLLLTCAHCIAETEAELDFSKPYLLLFSSGTVVTAQCTAWDPKRDLALLRITAAQRPPGGGEGEGDDSGLSHPPHCQWQFPHLKIADRPPKIGTKLVCVGQPGSEDLECEEAGVETGYEVLCVSEGTFRGYADGQDVQDNEEIGALMHTCWTYWGHSGAPLVERTAPGMGDVLVGLHSSWDDETGMRRGVGIEAIREFLRGRVDFE